MSLKINDYAQELQGIKGLDQRLARIKKIEEKAGKTTEEENLLVELKNELKVAADLVKLFDKAKVEFLKEEQGTRKADIKVSIDGAKCFHFEITTIRKDERREKEFKETLMSMGAASVRDYYEANINKLWDIYVNKSAQLRGPFNVLVIMTERYDFDKDDIMKFLFGGTSFEGTTLEEAIDKLIDGTFRLGSKIAPIDVGFNDKEEWIKEGLRLNIKGLIFRLFEGLFSHVNRDLVAVAFNRISKDTFFINPFSKLDFDIKKLFFSSKKT